MQHFDERLTAPGFWWFCAAMLGVVCGLTLLPMGLLPALVGLVVGGALALLGVSSYGAVRIRVVGGRLVAGSARIPVGALGEARALNREEAAAWRSHKADPRAFMVLRAYVPTAVRIEIVDPQDPTPYVYLSSRRPKRLVSALEAARSEAEHEGGGSGTCAEASAAAS
ncbi:DUF3093 domain-containing protein [Streptomyces sp. P38-E01]|uniref:DUF3093 domain-containing protein n=1 Tax=Streptomyces tardus TaxID=2780544 RepID=A0A949N6T8_9ACTN|nr:DUF3093 domain-containing protein [Streptomyces tardus]MBU7600349.1 DUF3093 domain-containing protein [Streptomyces tardus]